MKLNYFYTQKIPPFRSILKTCLSTGWVYFHLPPETYTLQLETLSEWGVYELSLRTRLDGETLKLKINQETAQMVARVITPASISSLSSLSRYHIVYRAIMSNNLGWKGEIRSSHARFAFADSEQLMRLFDRKFEFPYEGLLRL